ncbi:MAG: transcription elongation factor GreA, partial [Flavobacteriales bacterium]
MSKVNYFTKEGLEKLKKELEHKKQVERPKISNKIAEARDKGDLSENAEYDAAKEAQGILESEIAKLEEQYANARLIDNDKVDSSKACIMSTVTLKNKTNGQKMEYTLVSESEADLKENKLSVDSPIG